MSDSKNPGACSTLYDAMAAKSKMARDEADRVAQEAHQAEEIRRQVFPLMSARQRVHFWERAFLVALSHRYPHEDAKDVADEALKIRDLAVSEIVTAQVKRS